MLSVEIDGSRYLVPEGLTILEAVELMGGALPHLCHDQRLRPTGACRLCLVEVAGLPRPVPSCATQLMDGMRIKTTSDNLLYWRKTNLQLMADSISLAALNETAETPFKTLLEQQGILASGTSVEHPQFQDDDHPYIGTRMDRCILCQRCVRICDEVQGQGVWSVWGRGAETHVAPSASGGLQSNGCTSCGACVDTCPSDALYDKHKPPVQHWIRSTCAYCAVGCQLEWGVTGDRVVAVRPVHSPVNRGHLCAKGRYAFDYAQAPDRVIQPMIRNGESWQTVGWDEALDFVAQRLTDILSTRGADSIGILGSARATNEDNYLAQKFARVVIGNNNIDCCARVCHTPSAAALKKMLGTGAATNGFDDIEAARCFLVCGANPTENHPVVGARIKQAVRSGATLIVVDPRRIELAECADIHLAVKPGHNIELFNALAATLIEENLLDPIFIASRVGGLTEFDAFIRDYAPEKVAASCGVSARDIRAAARLYATGRPSMCFHGLGVTEHRQGTEGVMALINLALLTGNLGKPGSGINPLRGQNNVQGAAHMGCDPGILTGSVSLTSTDRSRFEEIWHCQIPSAKGKNLLAMMDAAATGSLKALWCMGYDIYLSLANASHTAEALKNIDLLIIQDLFLNETARAFGTVFLPAASVFEKDGTYMNSDRRVQRIRQAVSCPGQAQPDWWIIQELAQRMGKPEGFRFSSAEGIWNEVRGVWPEGNGLSYQRLETESLHWPCPDESHPGTPILYQEKFVAENVTLAQIAYTPSPEERSDAFPWILNTGRRIYQFNAGTMTLRSHQYELQHDDCLDISASDAHQIGVKENDWVKVSSRYGSISLPIKISEIVREGEVFASFHHANPFINRLTSPVRDSRVHTPEYKITAVHIEKCGRDSLGPVR